jgi:mycothiol system anti-sigma-R factor
MISCEEAAQRLYEYLDGELSLADYDKIKLHLELCRNCCQSFEFEKILRSIVRYKARSEKLPSSLKKSILREIEAKK